jgi:hypothetical protein
MPPGAASRSLRRHHPVHCPQHGPARVLLAMRRCWCANVQELLRNHKISAATFNAVRDRFGMQKILEITGLVGHYLLVGQILGRL